MSRRTAKRQRFSARARVRRDIWRIMSHVERYAVRSEWITIAELRALFLPRAPFYSPSIVDMLKAPA